MTALMLNQNCLHVSSSLDRQPYSMDTHLVLKRRRRDTVTYMKASMVRLRVTGKVSPTVALASARD